VEVTLCLDESTTDASVSNFSTNKALTLAFVIPGFEWKGSLPEAHPYTTPAREHNGLGFNPYHPFVPISEDLAASI
jgi:hypothetical protein